MRGITTFLDIVYLFLTMRITSYFFLLCHLSESSCLLLSVVHHFTSDSDNLVLQNDLWSSEDVVWLQLYRVEIMQRQELYTSFFISSCEPLVPPYWSCVPQLQVPLRHHCTLFASQNFSSPVPVCLSSCSLSSQTLTRAWSSRRTQNPILELLETHFFEVSYHIPIILLQHALAEVPVIFSLPVHSFFSK